MLIKDNKKINSIISDEEAKNRRVRLQTTDGKDFGEISAAAYSAVRGKYVDRYSPIDTNEKKVLDSYKKYVSKLYADANEKANAKKTQNKVDRNPVFERYGIDPDSFTYGDFEKWAKEHNFEYRAAGNDFTGTEYKWLPKQKSGLKFWEVIPSKEERADKKVLEQLAENNQRKMLSQTDRGAVRAAAVSAIDSATLGAVGAVADWQGKRAYKKAGLDPDAYASYKQADAKTLDKHKVAGLVGSTAGSMISLGGLSKGVSTAAKSVKWLAKTPQWVQNAINSGITFAVANGADTAFDGGDLKEVLINAGINFVGGTAGGALSNKVGDIGEKLLFNKGWQHKIIPEIVRNGLSSATFAGGKTASTYFLYPEEYRPTVDEMTKDIGAAFAFGAISSGLNTLKASSQNKRYLDDLYQKMAADYENMAKANISSKSDTAGIRRFAKNVIGYGNAMEAYLTGKEFSAEIEGKTYTFTPNKVRLVGQDKRVKTIISEIQTLKNNANAVLNGVSAPRESSAAPATNAGATTPAVVPTIASSATKDGTNMPIPSVFSAPVTNTPNAGAQAVTSVAPAVAAASATGELNEITSTNKITSFVPESADSEIKRLENIFIAKGADDISRKEIVDTALEIEKALAGSGKNMRGVFDNVSKITSSAIAKINSKVGASDAYWKLFGENFKGISSENATDNASLVAAYADAYTEALKNNNPEKYKAVIISADGTDLSAELPQTIMKNIIPAGVQNAGAYRLAAAQIKNIVSDVEGQISNERAEIYGAEVNNAPAPAGDMPVDVMTSEPKAISLTRVGDFYEAYGDEAVELANKLNLALTSKTINGERVQMVGFPVSSLDNYKSALGSGYKLAVSNQNMAAGVTADAGAAENSAVDKSMYDIMGEFGLTYDEQRAILEYKSSGSYMFNSKLRDGKQLTAEQLKKKEHLNLAIDKFPKYSGIAYRNIGFATQDGFDAFVDEHSGKHLITYPAFTSVSKDINGYAVNAPYLAHYEIECVNGGDVSQVGIEAEREVLFKTDTTFDFTIVKNTGNSIFIKMKEVSENGKGKFNGILEERGKQPEVQKPGSGLKNSGIAEEISGASDIIRGRSSAYDEVYNGASERNGGRIGSGSGPQDLGSHTEARNDSERERPLSGIRDNAEATLTDKCELIATKHTATGDNIWVVSLKGRLTPDEYKDLREKVKAVGGYYSRFAKTPDGKAIPGFVFKTEPTAKELDVFNDFFGYTEEPTPAENKSGIKEIDVNTLLGAVENANPGDEIKLSDYEKQNSTERALNNQPESDMMEENTDKDGAENAESKSEVLDRKSEPDGGRLHAGTSKSTVETGIEGTGDTSRDYSGKGLPESVGADGSRPDGRNDRERVHGTDDTANAPSERAGNPAKVTDNAPENIETQVKTIEKKRPSNKGNFVITDDIAAEFDNAPPSAKDNIEAIELLLALENEGRAATAEEKKTLAKYKGWGGIDTRRIPYELSSRFSELFDWEQRKAMQSSQNNAFFTPTKVIDAIYAGLKRMGFKGGNVLETSMGVGNFFGRMPGAMSAKSALTGVELESYTARIAQYLYPGATVINKPFQDVAIKNGSYDLVIGNVPFGQNKISYNKKKYSLHNYFIISSLDKVRDGGIVAVITSAGTLDSHSIDARAAIMDRADVVACYKLPEKVFSRNASTDVQSDLLILRKRASDEKPKGDSILNTVTTPQGFRINEYFDKHPENVLGTLAKGTNAWGEITTVLNDGSFYGKLNAAMKKLPKDFISGKVDLKPIETIVSLSDKPRFFEKNGKVYADDGAGTAAEVSRNQANTVRDYIAVRDAYKVLLNAYENGETVINENGTATIREMSDEDIKPLRAALSKAYDNFYKKHGAITGDGKKKIGTKKSTNNTFLEADADYYLVGGLERYDAKSSSFVKSALFEKDTLRKKKVTSVDAASDALAVSLNESGRVDFARMQELTGKTESQLAEELKGEIVLTPEGDYALTDIYLSGNIYEKLEAVKGKPEFKEQREMLEKVIPTPKGASDISVKLGANYIDSAYIGDFAREVLNSRLTIRKDTSGRWIIEGVRQSRYGDIVNVKYGCTAFNAVQLLEKILNDGEITATKKVGTGRDATTVFDAEMTDIARQKADDIRAAFESWVFADSARRAEIVDKYNRIYNNYRPLDYGRIAEKLSFDSMNDVLKSRLYPHQKKGIARFLFGGNILFAHGVGTGKTFEMIASVMEAKRMGIINKAAMVVPNNKVVDFKNDIAEAYPNAKVLVVDTANKKRQTMLGLVNSNDWDIVLIARTTFTKIPVSYELQAHYAAQQLEELELQIAEAESDRSVSKRQLKGMITQRDNLEQKLKDLNSDTKRDENSVNFEKLGIDCICVDEAHNYKSIMTPTKLDIKGLVNRNNAQMANDMLMKLDYLRSIDGKIIFGTGTPITNTVSEIYNMMRMVRPDILEDAGIHSLDEWVNTFAKIDTVTEIGIDNQIKNKSTQVVRSFINVSEMIGMFRQFADIVFTSDVVKNLPRAVYKDIEIDGTREHKMVEKQISEVIAKSKKSDLLKVYGQLMSMADAASVDLRMLSGAESEYNIFKDYSPDELEYANSKINTMCDIVYKEYTASDSIKGTQIIFCDKGSGSGSVYSFNLHKDIMQKLINRGIPGEQIVIIKNQSDAQLEALYDKVNAGEVRVLIGTSQKMAEGLNVQKRVVAIHHPTVTYKPSDKEQGDARGVRAGNINNEVHIYRYLQKNTFDSHKWQAQDRKGEMIDKALRGDAIAEMEDIGADEDSGAGVDAATAMAITSGNPLVKEKIDIDKEVVRLKTIQRNYLSEVYRYQDAISKNPDAIRRLTSYAANIEQDIALRDRYSEKASVVIKGKVFEKQSVANKALSDAVKTAPKNGRYTKLGSYNGFDIMFKVDTGGMDYAVVLKGANEYAVEYAGSGNNVARFAGVLNRLDTELTKVRERVETLKTDLEFAKKEVSKPFEKEKELEEALKKQKDITYRYEHYGEKVDKAKAEENSTAVHSSRDAADNDSASRWTTKRVEGGKDSKVNIAGIVKGIRDKFGIPISTGKVTDREATGIYKDKPEVIRTRIANNLPTISHELGHHLNKVYRLSGLESVKELRKGVSEEFLNQYPANAKNSEAVAEFVRIYLKNTNEAKRLCPDFYSDFMSALTKEDLKALDGIASSVNEYLSYNISERYDAAIVSSQKKERTPFKDRWHKWYSDWVDGFHPQKQAVDYVEDATGKTLSGKNNAYVLATNSLNAHTVANFLICEGFRDLAGNIIDAKSFVDSIGMIDSKNVKLLDKYLVLRHSLEWIAPLREDVKAKRVFADVTLENEEEIKKQISKIEKTHPEIKTAAENLYEYQNNVIRYFVIPAGGMTEDMLSTLNKKYPSYVPFYRAVGKKSGFAKGTFANQRSPIMRAKGSGELIISPTESIIRNTEKMVKFAMRNQVMRVWAKCADTVDGFGQFKEKVPPDMIPHFTNITRKKEQFTDALRQVVNSGEDYSAVSDLFDEMFSDAVADFTPVANANKRIVTVLKGGRPSYYQIHDEAFYKSVAELSPQQTTGLLRVSQMIMQPMKLLITQNNPIFAATNAIRDFGTAYKLSEINNPATFVQKYIQALGGIISNSDVYKQYKAMGGGHSSELSANIENISRTLREVAQKDMGKARRLAYSIFRHPVETVAVINDVIESTPRFMEFQRTLENGGDLQQAIYNADDITTNFKKSGKGAVAKGINKLVMFNNAAIQGVDKLLRTIAVKDRNKRYKILLKWLMHALIMGVIGYVYNKEVDEEGYKNLSSYKKNNFYNFAIGDGKFISLPKPRENALLDTFTERTIEYLAGENKDAFYDFGNYLTSQLLPPMLPDTLNPVDAAHSAFGSTVLGGLADVGFNQDFKGAPIESAYDNNVPSNERYTENTSKIAYGLGQTKLARDSDMSPKKIDHLISSCTGIFGQANKALFPINDSRRDWSIGLRNKFISDSNYSTDVLNRMYENQEKAEKAFNYKGTINAAVEYEKNSVITSYISGMNKAIKALPDEEQRKGRAYLLKSLSSWNYDNTASQGYMLKSLKSESNLKDCIITSVPKSALEWTEDKIKYTYQMTPQEYNEYVEDYLRLVEKYRAYQSKHTRKATDYVSALNDTNKEVKKKLSEKYQKRYKGKAEKNHKK